MKIYRFEEGRVGIIEREASPKLFRSIRVFFMALERAANKSINEDFVDGLVEIGLASPMQNAFNPNIIDMDEYIAIVMMDDPFRKNSPDELAKITVKCVRGDFGEGEWVDDEELLSHIRLGGKNTSQLPVYNWSQEKGDIEADTSESNDVKEEKREWFVYKLKKPQDIFKYRDVATSFYYYKHEYYILTHYLLDDFLKRVYVNVTVGREILPEALKFSGGKNEVCSSRLRKI